MGRGPNHYDCWGLVRHVLANEFGLRLPSYTYGDDPTAAVEAGVVHFQEIDTPRAGDLALFSGPPLHIGIMLCADSMLHITRGKDVCVERLSAFRTKKVTGFFRVRDLCEDEPV